MKIANFLLLNREGEKILVNIDNISNMYPEKNDTAIQMNHSREDGFPHTLCVDNNIDEIIEMLKKG